MQTQDQGRVGDTLKVLHYKNGDTPHMKLVFEYCEGERYYKYSGWKRTYEEYVAYDSPIKKADLDQFHTILADIVKTWYESHLRRNRDHIISHMKKTYEKGETRVV